MITIAAALLTLVAFQQVVYAHVDPTGCSSTSPGLQLNVFACPNANQTDLTGCQPVVGTGPVVQGEHLVYQAEVIFPGGSNCGVQASTLTVTTPDGVSHDVVPAGFCTGGAGTGSCGAGTTVNANVYCSGCTTLVGSAITLTNFGTDWKSALVPYDVNTANKNGAGFLFAQTTLAGVFHDSANDTDPASASPSRSLTPVGCSATLDKQVSCDGGTTWYDAADSANGGQNDDPNNASKLGCTANSGANVQIRFIAKNTGGAPINCTLSDTDYTIPNQGAVSIPGTLNETSSVTLDPFACNLTSGQNGDDTGTLASCTCPTVQDVGTVPGTGGSDTATYACCGVKIDKQVSCDDPAFATFADTGFVSNNEGGTNGCIGKVGGNIKAAWYVENTGNVEVTCNLTESNVQLFAGQNGISIPATQSVSSCTSDPASCLFHATTPLDCMTAHGAAGEPDTAALTGANNTCSCGGGLPQPPNPVTATDTATFECCGVAVDKQVQCNGGDWVDALNAAGDPKFNPPDDGLNGCTAVVGQPVAIRYFAENTGTLALTCNAPGQGLTDTQVVGPTVIFGPESVAGLTGNGSQVGPITNPSITECTTALNTAEASGNTAAIACTCTGSAALGGDVSVTASDTAKIQCSNPVFNITKTCDPVTGAVNTFDVKVTVNNTGNADLSCDITDQFFNGACPHAGSVAGTVPLTPANPVGVTAGQSATAENANFVTNTTVCNTASVTCLSGGQSFPNNTQTAEATCPVGAGCFTRTPGFWGNKLQYTQAVLAAVGNSLPSCGLNLNNTAANTQLSTTEDLCVNNFDACNNQTSSQQTSVIRACTAAALNLAVSALPDSGLNCESAHPGISALFEACCKNDGICDGGLPGNNSDLTNCIGGLDAFNNQFDTTDFPPALQGLPTAADSTQCQASNGNGFVNSGRNLGPKTGGGKCKP